MEYFNTRENLLGVLQKNLIIAEVGVFKGEFSQKILKICEPKELHLIDLWEGSMCSGDSNFENIVYIDNMEKIFFEMAEEYKNNKTIFMHRGDSVSTLENFKDGFFDFIYIDADHSYKGVKRDLDMAYRKSNKFIGGHDYCHTFKEVKRAVDEFCFSKKIDIKCLSKEKCSSFLIEKGNISEIQ